MLTTNAQLVNIRNYRHDIMSMGHHINMHGQHVMLNAHTMKKRCIRYIEDIQIFGMNMPFISLSEAKNAFLISHEWRSHE